MLIYSLDKARQWWIKTLNLTCNNRKCICDWLQLSDAVINVTQELLNHQFTKFAGLRAHYWDKI